MTEELTRRMQLVDGADRVSVLFNFFEEKGKSFYEEVVTQLEHALQCALLAEEAGSRDELVVSALLHDIGHLLEDEDHVVESLRDQDFFHEDLGAEFLQNFFPSTVTEPVRLHVSAKRYLCTVNENYYGGLSEVSKQSFIVQGGNLSEEQRLSLESNRALGDALKVREWDDKAKVPGLQTRPLHYYKETVMRCLGN